MTIVTAASAEEVRINAYYALRLFDSLELTINDQKSVLQPTQGIKFLGVILNTADMTAALPSARKERIKAQGWLLLKREATLLDLSSFIGFDCGFGSRCRVGIT